MALRVAEPQAGEEIPSAVGGGDGVRLDVGEE
jgi:hypothetical protein